MLTTMQGNSILVLIIFCFSCRARIEVLQPLFFHLECAMKMKFHSRKLFCFILSSGSATALQHLGVGVNELDEIQLCKSQPWKDQVSMHLERNEPDHQTMFLHFCSGDSKERVKSLLGGKWVQGISKENNMKRIFTEFQHFRYPVSRLVLDPGSF